MGRVEACRICLITDVKMERIQGSLETNIKSVFGHNVLYSSDLPDYSCYECSALISKFSKFRKKYLTAQSLLFNILQNHGVVTDKEIKNIDRVASKLSSGLSRSHNNDDLNLLEIKVECDPMEDVPDHNIDEEIDNSGSDDDVPLHSVKQIEHVNVNSINKKQNSNRKRQHIAHGSNLGESSNKIKKLQGNISRNDKLLQDFDVTQLTEQADVNGAVYLQADDFDSELPDMDNTIEETSQISLKLLENQNLMINNQNKIMSQIADFSTRLQTITKSDMLTGAAYKLSTVRVNEDNSVIESKQQLDELENELNDAEKRQRLKDKYSILFGGRGSGYTCAYVLVDVLFSRKFLTQCSWAGGSRGEESKIPFRSYKNIINFFHEMIYDCDKNFSMMDCYSFVKNVLRNSNKRSSSKLLRMSTGKRKRRASDIAKAKELLGLENT